MPTLVSKCRIVYETDSSYSFVENNCFFFFFLIKITVLFFVFYSYSFEQCICYSPANVVCELRVFADKRCHPNGKIVFITFQFGFFNVITYLLLNSDYDLVIFVALQWTSYMFFNYPVSFISNSVRCCHNRN